MVDARWSDADIFNNSGGTHVGTDSTTTGYAGLGTAVRKLGLATQETLEIDVVVSPTLLIQLLFLISSGISSGHNFEQY